MQIYRYKAKELKCHSSPIKREGRIFLWYFSRLVVQSIPSKISHDFLRPKNVRLVTGCKQVADCHGSD